MVHDSKGAIYCPAWHLSAFTPALENSAVQIPQALINVTSVNTLTGEIKFTTSRTVPSGRKWTGTVNVLIFTAKSTTTTSVTVSVS